MAKRSEIEGTAELEKTFRELGKVPQTAATQAARAGAQIALKSAKQKAPVDTGRLREGIILNRERKTTAGKAVYDVMMDPSMNDVFVKYSADGERSYYPASQEYGFLTVDGGYVPGYHFLRGALDNNKTAIERKILDTAGKVVDKILKNQGMNWTKSKGRR